MRLSLFPKMLGEIFAHPFSRSILIKSEDSVFAARKHADLSGRRLSHTNLQYADLRGANLRRADLQGANLQGAYLEGAHLEGANLRRADLPGADFRKADLQGAYLQEADLRKADLQGTYLRGADFQGADLRKAKRLTQKQIEWTKGSQETKLPEHLKYPELWTKSVEEQVQIVSKHVHGAD